MNIHSQTNPRRSAGNPKRSPGRPRVDDKRRRILDAAVRVFAERGFHGTAVPLVAAAAGVGTGTLYRYFPSKVELVNEVFRDAKSRLRDALLKDLELKGEPKHVFFEMWGRLARFARSEPLAFRFLELQDHLPYLDAESQALEQSVLIPVWGAVNALRDRGIARDMPMEALIALVWGALVGLMKAERLGYLNLSDDVLAHAAEACWSAVTNSQ